MLLCIGIPLLARLLDPADVPVLSQLVFPFLVVPVGSFAAGLSLGKRQGLCPLYPVLTLVLYFPAVVLVLNSSVPICCVLTAGAALAGNTVGTLIRWRKRG